MSETGRSGSERVVVIGGDAGGMAAVSQIRKGRPHDEVVVLERGRWTSYAACGIPFYVGGELGDDISSLVARSPEAHRRSGIDLRTSSEATAIDLASRRVEVRDLETDRAYQLDFDRLLIGTGGRPMRPPLPGIDLEMVQGAHTLDDAQRLAQLAGAGGLRVVVVGSGFIGIEMAEALTRREVPTVVLERLDQPLAILDPDLAERVAAAIRAGGIDLRTGAEVVGFEPGAVLTADGAVAADLVILGIGTAPNSDLAHAAGLELGVRGAIRVDDHQRTSADGVYAAGDCTETVHLVTGERVHVPLGTYANKQARVAGINLGGGDARFPGVLGTAITRFGELEISRTGASSDEAARAGFDAVTITVDANTRAHYYPGAAPITVRLLAERGTGRVLGAQILGGPGAGKRIDTCAVAITARWTLQDLLDADLAYAPPFSPVWDPVAIAAREGLKLV